MAVAEYNSYSVASHGLKPCHCNVAFTCDQLFLSRAMALDLSTWAFHTEIFRFEVVAFTGVKSYGERPSLLFGEQLHWPGVSHL